MDRLQEKPTVPYPPVGADGGQSLSQKPNQSIAEEQAEHKPQERDFREILRQIDRVNDPAYLPSLSMNELYEKVYPGKPPVVEGLLYPGVYLFVGAPKVGKSFLMAQLAYHVSKGLPLWGYEVRQGAVLYMALEDDYPRLQGRLYRMFGEDSAADLHLSIYAKQLNSGLEEQLMPSFLCDEMADYIKSLYAVEPTDRIFTVTKSYLHREMDRGAKAAGVKRIRIHDLRHSHISLLIDMGFTALAIADRVGHESIDITYRYAHLFPTRQTEMADRLDMERKGA